MVAGKDPVCRSVWGTDTVVFVHISEDTGLDRVHPTWAGTYVLDACVFLFYSINFALIDSDCVPVTLFEVQELWWSSTDSTQPVELLEAEKTHGTSSLAHSHKRARSVDAGRDTTAWTAIQTIQVT